MGDEEGVGVVRADDPAHKHTVGARRAVTLGDTRGLVRHLVGWLYSVLRGERQT